MRTKMSGPESLELALVMKKKERMRIGYFFYTAGSESVDSISRDGPDMPYM